MKQTHTGMFITGDNSHEFLVKRVKLLEVFVGELISVMAQTWTQNQIHTYQKIAAEMNDELGKIETEHPPKGLDNKTFPKDYGPGEPFDIKAALRFLQPKESKDTEKSIKKEDQDPGLALFRKIERLGELAVMGMQKNLTPEQEKEFHQLEKELDKELKTLLVGSTFF